MIASPTRPELRTIPLSSPSASLGEATREGLKAPEKSLPSRFFYDVRGSALFERITTLPAYYPTRTELAILRTHACEMLDDTKGVDLVEFGAGSGSKTRTLLDSLGSGSRYLPIDISGEFLAFTLDRLADEFPRILLCGLAGDWLDALDHLPEANGPRIFLFLGSSLGNLPHADATTFLRRVRERMRPGDAFLLGVDRTKTPSVIEAAYNDPEGVTEAFNKNLLGRINRELGGDFPLHRFRHRAIYDPITERIEMRLESRDDRTVEISDLNMSVRFRAGETIHTEWSYKYSLSTLTDLAASAGLRIERNFSDSREWFSVLRLVPGADA